mmetsp:Transcript_24372/g.53868  ORF Transcript_24372/g.53868 Transcript_24372/m.53868 type:complete len:206 (+) Transcript_24372:441-1058(+)
MNPCPVGLEGFGVVTELGLLVEEGLLLDLEGLDSVGNVLGRAELSVVVAVTTIVRTVFFLEGLELNLDGFHLGLDVIHPCSDGFAIPDNLLEDLLLGRRDVHGVGAVQLGRLVVRHLLGDGMHGGLLLVQQCRRLLLALLFLLELGNLIGQGGVLGLESLLGLIERFNFGIDVGLELRLQGLETGVAVGIVRFGCAGVVTFSVAQ